VSDDELRPTAGARYLLEREDVAADGRRARYRARVLTPDATYAYAGELIAGGEPELAAVAEAAPAELADALVMLARLTARGVDKRLADGMPPWPERVLRWRGPGRGG
jgi:hypothetical protein